MEEEEIFQLLLRHKDAKEKRQFPSDVDRCFWQAIEERFHFEQNDPHLMEREDLLSELLWHIAFIWDSGRRELDISTLVVVFDVLLQRHITTVIGTPLLRGAEQPVPVWWSTKTGEEEAGIGQKHHEEEWDDITTYPGIDGYYSLWDEQGKRYVPQRPDRFHSVTMKKAHNHLIQELEGGKLNPEKKLYTDIRLEGADAPDDLIEYTKQYHPSFFPDVIKNPVVQKMIDIWRDRQRRYEAAGMPFPEERDQEMHQ